MTKLYGVYDKVKEKIISVGMADTDNEFIRETIPYMTKLYPIKDLELKRLGEIDKSGNILTTENTNINIKSYSFEEEAKKIEGTEEEIKNKIIKENK